ncbi:MAG: four helix bundle protein [Anaerolineae bacterium]|jgi:four helix bundle protein|nr:four helix bundle protein [Anaerolineae bacterium]MDH7473002.1 four helix bundle protein [Anaerolineae bacterium]
MTYEEWEQEVPQVIKSDPVWQFYAYRKALFLYDLAWEDCGNLIGDPRGRAVAEQLIRSSGSVCANIEEGYGRGYGKDRNYFLRISVGSARETRGWYYRGRQLLSPTVLDHRLNLLSEIIALLITELRQQRQRH